MWNIKNRIAKLFHSDQNDPTRPAGTHYEPAVELNHDAIYADAVHLYLDQQLPYSSNLTRLGGLKRFLKKNVNPFLKTGAKPYPNITRRRRLWKKNEFKVEIFGMTYERTPSEVKLHILLNSNSRAAPIIKAEEKDPDELQTSYGSNWISDRHDPHPDVVESQTRRRPTLNASQPLEVLLEEPLLPPGFQVETLSSTQSGQLAPQPPTGAAIPPDDLPAQPPVPAAGPPFPPVEPPVPPVQPPLRPLEPPAPPLEPPLPPLDSPAPPLEPPAPPLDWPLPPLEPPHAPLESPPPALEMPALPMEPPAPPLEPPLPPLASPAPSLETPAPPMEPPAPPAQPVVSNQGALPPNGAASARRSSQRPSVVQSTGAACERIYSTDAIKMVNVGARWCKTHAHKQMSNDDGNAWVRSAWLAVFSQLDPETLEATLTAKMTGRALENDIHAVVELVTLIEQKGVRAVESSDFEAAFEAAHGSMANLTFELINARDKAKYRVDKQGHASTSDDGPAPFEARRELYRERKAQRSSLFAALNNPENTGSSQHIAKLMEELGVDAVIAEIKNSDDDRFVIHAQPGSGLAELTMTREPKFNAFELSRALTHKPVITMEPPGWGVQLPLAPQKSGTCLPANPVNRTPALATSRPSVLQAEQVPIAQQAQTTSRNTADAPPDSNQNTLEPPTPAFEAQAAPNRTNETHSVAASQPTAAEHVSNASNISVIPRTPENVHASSSRRPRSVSVPLPIQTYGIGSIDTIAHQILPQDSPQRTSALMNGIDAGVPVLVQTDDGTEGDCATDIIPDTCMQAVTQPDSPAADRVRDSEHTHATNQTATELSFAMYSQIQIPISILTKKGLEETHRLINMSPESYNCWLRAAWFLIFTQCDPTTLRSKLESALGSRLYMTEDELKAEARIDEVSIDDIDGKDLGAFLRDQREIRNSFAERVGRNTLNKRNETVKKIELIIEAVTAMAQAMKTGAGLWKRINSFGDVHTFKMDTEEEDHLKDITYSILKKIRSEHPADLQGTNLTTSIYLVDCFGDDMQITALLGALGFDTMMLHVSEDPNSDRSTPYEMLTWTNRKAPELETIEGNESLEEINRIKNRNGEKVAGHIVGCPIVVHQGVHFQAYEPI